MYKLPSYHQNGGMAAPAQVLYRLEPFHEREHCSTSDLPPIQNLSMSDLDDMINDLIGKADKLKIDMTSFVQTCRSKKGGSKAPVIKDFGPYFQQPSTRALIFEGQEGISRAFAQFKFPLLNASTQMGGKLSVCVGEKFAAVVDILKKIGSQRKVDFEVKSSKNEALTVDFVSCSGQKFNSSHPLVALLMIGEAVGVYSYRDYHLVSTNEWLERVEHVFSGKECANDLSRDANIHLGPNDLFTNSHSVSLADIVMFVVLKTNTYNMGNVESFVARVATALV